MILEPGIAGLMPACINDVTLRRAHDIGGFEVRRALPATRRQMVGPFILFDQIDLDEVSVRVEAGRIRLFRAKEFIPLSEVRVAEASVS